MNIIGAKIAEYVIPKPKRWLLQDLTYFVDKSKYHDQSPIQDHVKKIQNTMIGSMFMGVVATAGIMFSLRRQLYSSFRVFTYKRASIQLITLVSVTSVIFSTQGFSNEADIVKIKKQLLQMNSPILYDYLRTRLFNQPGMHQYQLFRDIMKKQEYDQWKKKTKITL